MPPSVLPQLVCLVLLACRDTRASQLQSCMQLMADFAAPTKRCLHRPPAAANTRGQPGPGAPAALRCAGRAVFRCAAGAEPRGPAVGASQDCSSTRGAGTRQHKQQPLATLALAAQRQLWRRGGGQRKPRELPARRRCASEERLLCKHTGRSSRRCGGRPAPAARQPSGGAAAACGRVPGRCASSNSG